MPTPPRYPFRPLHWRRLALEAQRERAQAFADAMAQRRSVRQFSRDPVPFELIELAIRAAATAPSGANQQPWTFVAVGDPTLKARIRAAAEAEERESYAHRMAPEWLEALAPLGTDWHKPHMEDAPWLIVVFEQVTGRATDESGRSRRVKHYYPKESVGIAVGLLLAALHTAGLATLVHTPSPMKFLQELLERPTNERAFCVIPVGYPAPDAQVPDIPKKPLGDVLVRK
ncbi:MAG TPA: nitroreductase family protein [bacterium]|nr:nitroreductase family protein [bacterium]